MSETPTPGHPRYDDPVNIDDLVRLRKARDRIDRSYASPLTVPELAAQALMSTAHFSRMYKTAYGESPYQHLQTRRIERAKTLLRSSELPVTEICFAVGFTSLGSFSARFSELVGVSPSAYRAQDHTAIAAIPGCVVKAQTRPAHRTRTAGPPDRADSEKHAATSST